MLLRTSLILLALSLAALAEPPSAGALIGLWEVLEVKDLTTGKVEPKRRERHTQLDLKGDTLVTRDNHPADGHMRQWTMRRVE